MFLELLYGTLNGKYCLFDDPEKGSSIVTSAYWNSMTKCFEPATSFMRDHDVTA